MGAALAMPALSSLRAQQNIVKLKAGMVTGIDQVGLPLGQFVLDPREPFYRLLTDWPLSFLHGGEPDVEVAGESVLPLHPCVPPPLPPSPPAVQPGGPETVPGYAPGPLAEPAT
jgi:hypothetical protein